MTAAGLTFLARHGAHSAPDHGTFHSGAAARRRGAGGRLRLAAATLAAGVAAMAFSLPAAAADKVQLQLNWFHLADHSPIYLALKRGYYKEEGLDLTVLRGSGSADSAKKVDLGQSDVGISDAPTVLTAISKGANLKMVAVVYDKAGNNLFFRKSANIKSATQLNGATICVLSGTTTELNLTDWFRTKKMTFRPVVINELSQIEQAFFSGRCDVQTTDISGLAATRMKAPNKDDYVILPEAISKEPLGPLVRRGDWEFFTIVKWTLNGLIEAEEYGVTSANVDKLKGESKDPPIQRLVGTSGDIGKGMGLDNDWLVRAIKAVGNYGELYQRNIGPIGIARGQNAQWKDGGLMYAPPIR